MTKEIKKHNSQQFLEDLKSVRDVVVFTSKSNAFLRVTKREVLKEAESKTMHYYMSDKIFRVRRYAMVLV